MKAYSMDLRQRVLKDVDQGMSTRNVATKYDVSESWVRRLKQRRRETGEIAPRESGYRRPPEWLPYADRIRAAVEQCPDITLEELRRTLGVKMSIQTLSRALRVLQLTFKKKS